MFRTFLATAGLLLLAGSPALAQKCADYNTRWFFYPSATMPDGVTTVPSAISGDGNWYGTSGPTYGSIHICGSNPSYDSTIVLPTKRYLTYSFPAPIPGSVINQSLPGAPGVFVRSGFVNVRNILCHNCSVDRTQPFTSRISYQINNLVGRDTYRLRFMQQIVDAPDLHTDPSAVPGENMPYASSAVLVIPQPYNCTSSGTVKPAWVVRGTMPNSPEGFLQVGTLYNIGVSPAVHAGQYSMPFEIRIEALSCFSW